MSFKTISYLWVTVLFMFGFSSCYEEISLEPEIENQNALLTINKSPVFFDFTNKMALCPVRSFGDFDGVVFYGEGREVKINNIKVLESSKAFHFGEISAESSFPLELKNADESIDVFTLQFTLLPVVAINHKYSDIPKDEKVVAVFTLFDPYTSNETIEYCGIELRGASSSGYGKKSYGFEIRNNTSSTAGKNVELLDMYYDDDWILNAAYADLSNIRNRASFDIWNSIQSDGICREYNVLPSSTSGRFVEVFVNSEYLGIYCLCEKITEKKLDLQSTTGGEQCFLYKSEGWSDATMFIGVEDTLNQFGRWAEWEQKYPDSEDFSCWKPLYEMVDFVSNVSDSVFACDISSFLVQDQAIDYYILLNLMNGADNAGKNIFLAKETINEPFYICPWDMDATWGRDWRSDAASSDNLVSFALYDRLIHVNPNRFKEHLTERWAELRKTVLQNKEIFKVFDYYTQQLLVSGAYSREETIWPSSMNDPEVEFEYISQWIDKRTKVLDEYFSGLSD